MKLKDKVAIVAGGARDIGRSVSVRLAREGAKVAVNWRGSEADKDITLKTIADLGGEAIAVRGDMTRAADVARLVGEARAAFGGDIDILVNVVGGMVARKPLADMDEEFLNGVMRLNLNSTFLTMQAAVPFMKPGAAIINLSSLAARDGGGPGASAYAASKAAVATFTRSMAKELGPKGIRVNALCPGLIGTTFHDTFSTPQGREKVASNTPLGREGHPDEIAAVVAFLASQDAAFITGANLDVNGGLYFS